MTKRGLSVGSDSSVSSTEIDFTKGSYLDQLKAKMGEAKAAKRKKAAPAKKAPELGMYGKSFLADYFREGEE